MRRFGFIVGLSLLTPTLVLSSSDAAASEADVHAAYVKVGLTRGDMTFQHPGFLMAMDEQGVFVIECEGKEHEITVSFAEASADRFTLRVQYDVGGRTQWIEKVEVAAGVDTEFTKGRSTMIFNVDPQGSGDSTRDDEDKVEGPDDDEDSPLGGLKLK